MGKDIAPVKNAISLSVSFAFLWHKIYHLMMRALVKLIFTSFQEKP